MRTKPRRKKVGIFVLFAAVLLVGTAGAQTGANETTLISRADGADGAAGNGRSFSFSSVVSEDGRYVAFTSAANNLDPDDTDTTFDVFVRDTQTGATTLVSRATGAGGEKGNNSSNIPSISDDGRFVAFRSAASNLDPADAASTVSNDIYVRDLELNTTTLVSRQNGFDGEKANGANSDTPSISADGRYVAFQSNATNLDPADADVADDIFVRDLQENTTTLASRAGGSSGEKGDNFSRKPSISDDGLRVAFRSAAGNLHPDDTDFGFSDVFVRDLSTNETMLASRADGAGGATGNSDSFDPSISGDGLHVVFTSFADNLHPADDSVDLDAFVRDLSNDATILASRRSGANGAAASGGGFGVSLTSISDDGRIVAFDSDDTNLHRDDKDTIFDVFLRDVQENTTILASRASGASGDKGDSDSGSPSLSGDGGHVAFQSFAENLHPDDPDIEPDVFLRAVDTSNPRGCTITGTEGNDTNLRGTDGDDVICGLGGNDTIRGLGGDDTIYGDEGDDKIKGGPGDDRLFGGKGKDRLKARDGVEGNDLADGGKGRDRCKKDRGDQKTNC